MTSFKPLGLLSHDLYHSIYTHTNHHCQPNVSSCQFSVPLIERTHTGKVISVGLFCKLQPLRKIHISALFHLTLLTSSEKARYRLRPRFRYLLACSQLLLLLGRPRDEISLIHGPCLLISFTHCIPNTESVV